MCRAYVSMWVRKTKTKEGRERERENIWHEWKVKKTKAKQYAVYERYKVRTAYNISNRWWKRYILFSLVLPCSPLSTAHVLMLHVMLEAVSVLLLFFFCRTHVLKANINNSVLLLLRLVPTLCTHCTLYTHRQSTQRLKIETAKNKIEKENPIPVLVLAAWES